IGLFHYIITLICGLGYSGYSIFYQSIGFVIISACDLDINRNNKGWLSLAYMIGLAIGASIFGRLADAYGRRKILLFSLTINLIAMLLSAFAYNYNMLVILAAIIGCSHAGLLATIYNYLMEFFPRQYRGIAGACMSSFLIFESLLGSTVAFFTLPHSFYKIGGIYFSSWRLYLIIVMIPTLIGYCILLFLPDSLRFTLAKSERKKAEFVLKKINRINSCFKCRNDLHKQYALPLTSLHPRASNRKENNSKTSRFRHELEHFRFFGKQPWLRRLLLLSVGWFGFCFGDQGFSIWLPSAVSYYTSGKTCWHSHQHVHNISHNAMHSLHLNSSACQNGEKLKTVIIDILIGNLLSLPVAIGCLLLINRVGRKWLYFPMITICALSILLMVVIDNVYGALILGCVFTSISNNAWIPYKTWSAELFPTKVRSTSTGILNIVGHTGSILGMTTFAVLFNKNCTATLIIFSLLGFLSGFTALFLPDT
ncbi:uncharacterized protein TRIADDRAFT_596, partial [Trichoplax adhaerens]